MYVLLVALKRGPRSALLFTRATLRACVTRGLVRTYNTRDAGETLAEDGVTLAELTDAGRAVLAPPAEQTEM